MVQILDSKVIDPATGSTWYYLIADEGDIFPGRFTEFPAGSGHYPAQGSRVFEKTTEIRYELQNGLWVPIGQVGANWKKKTITENGKYYPEDDECDAYSVVTVLVDATLEPLEVTASADGDFVISKPAKAPGAAQTGYGDITVKQVTAAVDSNIKPENIKAGVTILGVEGTYTGE